MKGNKGEGKVSCPIILFFINFDVPEKKAEQYITNAIFFWSHLF